MADDAVSGAAVPDSRPGGYAVLLPAGTRAELSLAALHSRQYTALSTHRTMQQASCILAHGLDENGLLTDTIISRVLPHIRNTLRLGLRRAVDH